MANRQTMTVSLPPEMIREVDRIRRKEGRTRSELIREALRRYKIDQLPITTPTARELKELEKGRAEMTKRGEYFTLDEFKTWLLGTDRKKTRTKKSSPRIKA
jgi:predicted transcriptional regulator